MDPKYVAILVLMAIVIDNGTCAADCDALTKCMNNFGATFNNLQVNLTDKAGVIEFLDEICNTSNIDSMVKCYSPQNLMGCTVLRNFVKQIPAVESLRDQLTTACSQKEELYLVSQCLTNDNVTSTIKNCSTSVVKTSGQETKAETICAGMLSTMTCVETAMIGHCSEKTMTFLKSYYKEQYDDYCSVSSRLTASVLLICLFTVVLQFLFK